MRLSRAWVALVFGVTGIAACSSAREPTGSAPPIRDPRIGPAVDLATVVRDAALAYRAESGSLVSGGTTFTSTIAAGGAIAIAPHRGTENGSALTIATSRIARGGAVVASDDGAPALDRGAVVIHRGEVIERIADDDAGVEQSWSFDRAPLGDGDLVVHVDAIGERFTAGSDHGLHFKDGAFGLRYGTAVWVDANGNRTVVMPQFVDGEIRIVVPSAVVAASRFPAVLDPTISPEQEVDQPITGGSASGEQYNPWIAALGPGKGYFAIWYDARGIRPALYGARIGTDGTVLDDTGVPVATGVSSTTPYIASGGDGYIVVWAVSYLDVNQNPGVYAVRLDANGNPLDPAPVAIVANETNVQSPTAAFDGTNYFVTWQRYGGVTGYDIAGARIGKTGGPLDAPYLTVSNLPDYEYSPFVTYDGTNYLVAWNATSGIYVRRYGKDGAALGDAALLVAPTTYSINNIATAFDGTQHLITWSEYTGTGYAINGRRVSPLGVLIDGADLPIANDTNYNDRPRAIYDGTEFLVGYSRGNSELMAARVTSLGAVLDVPPIAVSASYYYDYALASDGAATIAINRDTGTGLTGSDIKAVKIPKVPVAAAPLFVVSKSANSETEPSVAWNGASHFAAWLDTRDGHAAIYGAMLDANGQPQNAVKLVSDVRFTSGSTRPRVASDGAAFLVVFDGYDSTTTKYGVHAIRVDANGTPDAAGFFDLYLPLASNEVNTVPAIAYDGTNYLVVWQQQSNDGGSQTGIAGIRIGQTGTTAVDKQPLRISTTNPVESRLTPDVAFDGQNYYVTWNTTTPTPSSIAVSHVFGTRVSKDGTPLDGEQVVCNAFLLQTEPRVAGDTKNGGFFVTWNDYRTAIETADVYGARITKEGQNLDGPSAMLIAAGDQDKSSPHVAASGDGTNFVVAWRDLRSKQTYDIYGAWISIGGRNHDPDGLALSAEAGDEDSPVLAPTGPGKLLLSYQRLDPRAGYGSYRIRARTIDSGAPVAAPCTKDDDCASRSCVDGFCCYTDCNGCGVCNVQPGTCTPVNAGSESPKCPNYLCKGSVDCPSTCASDTDCASNASCDATSHTCIARTACTDDHTLKDLTGKVTDCTPFKCEGVACRTQCASVDDCAEGFVCDTAGRCVPLPDANDGGCAVAGEHGPLEFGALAVVVASVIAAHRRKRRM